MSVFTYLFPCFKKTLLTEGTEKNYEKDELSSLFDVLPSHLEKEPVT